jgi:hypothetical protein
MTFQSFELDELEKHQAGSTEVVRVQLIRGQHRPDPPNAGRKALEDITVLAVTSGVPQQARRMQALDCPTQPLRRHKPG